MYGLPALDFSQHCCPDLKSLYVDFSNGQYLEQLNDTKYGNPCRRKIQPPPTQIEIFTPENSKLQYTHSSLRLRQAINGALQILIFLKQYDQGDVKFYVNFAAISNTNYLNLVDLGKSPP